MINSVKDLASDTKAVIQERLFSPMYFYFIIAWIITNWQFSYVLFFTSEEFLGIPKVEYLASFYRIYCWTDYIWNFLYLFPIPAFFAYVTVWWVSQISEKFYERYEQYKINKEVIKRKLIYKAKYQEVQDQKAIRDVDNELKTVKYDDNVEFNNYLDSIDERVLVMGYPMQPSRVLYNMDYVAYTDELQTWKEQQSVEDMKEKVRDEVIEEYRDGLDADRRL